MSDHDDQLKHVKELEAENSRLKADVANLESLVKARTEQVQVTLRELERSYDLTLEALGDALGRKEGETAGHSRRVTALTIVIAKAMGISQEQIPTIARGAFLHDIGKLAIPDAILRKPGKLTPEETGMMQEHCLN